MRASSPILRSEKPDDHDAIRAVNLLAFDREDEGQLVDALRMSGDARLSLIAEIEGRVVGHILFSILSINTPAGPIAALALAPMAVVPEHQRQGIGSALVREGLRISREQGHRIVIVVGYPEYYPRFGFSTAQADRLRSPYSGPAFMALALVPGALDAVEGEVRYPSPFSSL